MKFINIIQNAIIMTVLLQVPDFAHATQIITLQIDPLKSWVQDQSWSEILPDSAGKIPSLTSELEFGEPLPEVFYHIGERFSLSGNVNVILGRDYPSSIEIEGYDIAPGDLPSGREVIIDSASLTLIDNVFPNNSFSLPDGFICACFTLANIFAPNISGFFDGESLSVDFNENNSFPFVLTNILWADELSASGSVDTQYQYNLAQNQYSFHIEASIAPVATVTAPAPSVFVLLMPAFGLMVLFRGNIVKEYT